MRLAAYYKARSRVGRRSRLLYPSPAELALIRLMGGVVVTVPFIKHWRRRFPLAIVLYIGRTFRREKVQREVRIGRYYVDFGNDLKRAIEVDGAEWHTDRQRQDIRDAYILSRGWRILRIPAYKIHREPAYIKKRVRQFLED